LRPDPILFGGGHENERRAGTENLPAIIGLAESLRFFVGKPVFDAVRLRALTDKIAVTLRLTDGVELVGDQELRLANTLAFVVRGSDSISLLAGLDLEGICASSGSACSAGSLEPSHVVSALGFDRDIANALVRFSLGRDSTENEVDFVLAALPEIIRRAQAHEKRSNRS
jgi:cysteine desulfurase